MCVESLIDTEQTVWPKAFVSEHIKLVISLYEWKLEKVTTC